MKNPLFGVILDNLNDIVNTLTLNKLATSSLYSIKESDEAAQIASSGGRLHKINGETTHVYYRAKAWSGAELSNHSDAECLAEIIADYWYEQELRIIDCILERAGCSKQTTIIRGCGRPVDFKPIEVLRDGLRNWDYLISRRALILHPEGYSFIGVNVEGVSPTNDELCDNKNWRR